MARRSWRRATRARRRPPTSTRSSTRGPTTRTCQGGLRTALFSGAALP